MIESGSGVGIGSFFKYIGMGFVGIFVNPLSRNIFLISLTLLLILYTPTKMSIEKHDWGILIANINSRIVSFDNEANYETEKLKQNPNSSALDSFLAIWKILGSLYLSAFCFGYVVYLFFNMLDLSKTGRNIAFAIIFVYLFQIFSSAYILLKSDNGTLKLDTKIIIGEKSIWETGKFIMNPFKGLINTFRNLNVYLDPIGKSLTRIFPN